ncbi:MAG: 50S ribosomal protein L25 [Candidatus Spechtbacterales bacterium]
MKVKIRTALGKKSKKLRRENQLPGVLYGRKIESTPVSIEYKEFEKVYAEARENTLVSLEIDSDSESVKGVPGENVVLIRDAIMHPLRNSFIHVDFYQVSMDEEIKISIPLAFVNEAPAVKDEGAVLERNIFDLEVSALPKDLPREITVDLSKLAHIGDAILVKDLTVQAGVKIEAGGDIIVVQVSAPAAEEITEQAQDVVAPEDIKTEGEEKREEKAKEAAALEQNS